MELENPYIVYALSNSNGYITSVNSSAFLRSTENWVVIDSGYGDRYHHAQGNYFPESIFTDGGAYRYKLADGVAVECTAEEIAAQEEANRPAPEFSVWDELDGAYQAGYTDGYTEGVNIAYDQ